MSLGRKHKHIFPIPKNHTLRLCFGVLLIVGGIFSILPVLGIWMIPLGLFFLSVDSKFFRRKRRQLEVRIIQLYQNFKK